MSPIPVMAPISQCALMQAPYSQYTGQLGRTKSHQNCFFRNFQETCINHSHKQWFDEIGRRLELYCLFSNFSVFFLPETQGFFNMAGKIGRASWREKELISVVAESLKKK